MNPLRKIIWALPTVWLFVAGWSLCLAQNAPRNVSLSTPFSEVNLGTTITLTGKARDDDSQLNFLFYVSTSDNPSDKGTLIAQEAVAGCTATLGCARSVGFQASAVATTHFFLLEVQDGVFSRLSTKVAVEVSPFDEVDPPSSPTPVLCECGPTMVTVDAGRPMEQVLGGQTLQLEAAATATGGGGGVNPDFFEWTIVDDGGLGEDLELEDADMKSARLLTPDVTQDATVRLHFAANLANCGCSDEQTVTVLADPPPQTDLAISISDGGQIVLEKREVTYQISVVNNGPEGAPDVEFNSLLPAGAGFVEAQSSQGVCSSDGLGVVCLLGELASGAEVDLTLTLLTEADGDLAVTSVVSSGATELEVGNNAAVEITTVEPIYELFFAQFGDGTGSFFSEVILYNLDPENDSPATLFVRSNEGTPLTVDLNGSVVEGQEQIVVPAGGLRILRTDGLGEELILGSLTVESERPLSGVILFGGANGLAGVGASDELPSAFLAPMDADEAQGIRTGIAVINLSTSPSNLSVRLFDSDGTQVASDQLPQLPGQGHRAAFLNELIDSENVDTSNFRGVLEVTSDRPIAATVIQVRPGQFATMPVTPVPDVMTTSAATAALSVADVGPEPPSAPFAFQSEPPSPTICPCDNGKEVVVDAGPVSSSVVGGRTLRMMGSATGPSSGGGGVTPGILNWSIVADAGLGSSLQILDSDKLTATLVTPDIDQNAIVTVGLQANFEGCLCTDNRVITILGEAPPEADLALGKVDSRDPVTTTREFDYKMKVVNNGPDTATGVVVSDPLPNGIELINAAPAQGTCTQNGQTVLCSLGDIPADGEVQILLTIRSNVAGTIQNVAQVSSAVSDPSPANNAASETTLVRPLQVLNFAQFGDGEQAPADLFSQILLYNLNRNRQSELSIELRQENGQPLSVDLNGDDVDGVLDTTIPAGGLRVFQTDGSGALQRGSVSVLSDTSLAGVIVFGGSVGLAGVGASAQLEDGFLAPMESHAQVRTGVAIMSLEDRPVKLTMILLDSNGQELETVSPDDLSPRGSVAAFVDELFAATGTDLSDFEGLLRVESDGRIAATVIQLRPGQFATMPVSAISGQ